MDEKHNPSGSGERQFQWYDGVIKRNHLHQCNVMETLSFIRDISPDASMAMWNFLRLANNGHEMEVADTNGNPDEPALDYINNLAARVGKLYGGGTDQLINVMLLTGYTQGAIALEVELDENLKDVRDFTGSVPTGLSSGQRDAGNQACAETNRWKLQRTEPESIVLSTI